MKNAEIVLIHKFLTGEISESEKEEFANWLIKDPKNLQNFEELKLIWDLSEYREETLENDPVEELQKIRNRMNRLKKNDCS